MTDATQRARELAKKLRHAVMSAPPDIDADEAMEPILCAALLTQQAETWREAAKVGDEQSPHHTGCALKWARKCESKAKECEAHAAGVEK